MSRRISFGYAGGMGAILILVALGRVGAEPAEQSTSKSKIEIAEGAGLKTEEAWDYVGKWLLGVGSGSRKSRGGLEITDNGGVAKAEMKLRVKGEPVKITGLARTDKGLAINFENTDEAGVTKALRLILKKDGEKLTGLAMDDKGGVAAEVTAARVGSEAAKELEAAIVPEEGASEGRAAALRREMAASKLSIGGKDISIVVGNVSAKGKDYKALGETKDGAVVVLTESFAIKLKTPHNLRFGDKVIKAGVFDPSYPGVYSVWLKKAGAGWHLVFNSEADVWGTMHNPGADVAEVAIEEGKGEKATERLGVELKKDGESGGVLVIAWGEREWKAGFRVE